MSNFPPPRVLLTSVIAVIPAMALMVAAAYLWVFVYSLAIAPGHDPAFYTAYAQQASPVVAVITAGPVFYAVGRFMRRFESWATSAALTAACTAVFIDVVVVIAMTMLPGFHVLMSALSAIAKVGGAWLGSRHERQRSMA